MKELTLIDKDGNEYSAGKYTMELEAGGDYDADVIVDIRVEGRSSQVVGDVISDIHYYLTECGGDEVGVEFKEADKDIQIPEKW